MSFSAKYFPFRYGKYDNSPGLHTLSTTFGNGQLDQKIFQIDPSWEHYRQQKMSARKERLDKYLCLDSQYPKFEKHLCSLLASHMIREYPEYFVNNSSDGGNLLLHNQLSSETLVFDKDMKLVNVRTGSSKFKAIPNYSSSFDALACQIQEDIALVSVENNSGDNNGADKLIALHLCFPNHWAAEDKIGNSFIHTHAPVPDMQRTNKKAAMLLRSLVNQGPFVRFAWGLATDRRLNHHPTPPEGAVGQKTDQHWVGRKFDTKNPELFVRTERQLTIGIPEINAFVFTIRTYFEDVPSLPVEMIKNLAQAIQSMSHDALIYKGIDKQKKEILQWLKKLSN